MTSNALVKNTQDLLGNYRAEITKSLPSHIDENKFIRCTQTAIQKNPTILNANRESLFASVLRAAELGLLPDGKEASIIPRGKVCALEPGYYGLLKLFRQSGEAKSIHADVIYTNDEFDYWIDEEGPHLKHIPFLTGDRGKRTGAYAVATLKSGGVYLEIIDEKTIEAVKDLAKNSQAWNGPFESEMVKKVAIKRLAKRLPSSADIDDLINVDNENYDLEQQTPTSNAAPKKSGVDALKEAAGIEAKPKVEEKPPIDVTPEDVI